MGYRWYQLYRWWEKKKYQIKSIELSYELCRFSFGSLYTSTSGLIHVVQYYLYQLFITMIASS